MGSRGRLLFDLNEPPTEDDEETDRAFSFQPQKALPSADPHTSDLFVAPASSQGIINNNAFSHASSVSGFQPFVRPKHVVDVEQKKVEDLNTSFASSSSKLSNSEEMKASPLLVPDSSVPAIEREEGEWSDAEGSGDVDASSSLQDQTKTSQGAVKVMDCTATGIDNKVNESSKDKNDSQVFVGMDQDSKDQKKSNNIRHIESNAKDDLSLDDQDELVVPPKQREVKGIEGSHGTKSINNPARRKLDQQKEAMLGKKRSRQTVFLPLEDVRQAGGPPKSSTPRRQNPPIITRTIKEVKEVRSTIPSDRVGDKQNQVVNKDQKQLYDPSSCTEGGSTAESCEPKPESNGDINAGVLGRPKRLNNGADFSAEGSQPPLPRQSSWKPSGDTRSSKSSQFPNKKQSLVGQSSMDAKLGSKKHPPARKATTMGNTYQDTSVERLIREVTNEKFWHHPGTLHRH